MIPVWDLTLGAGRVSGRDAAPDRRGADVPLTDNPKTVTRRAHRRGAGAPSPDRRGWAGTTAATVLTCVPYDPESKGGAEATVRIAKADLVPTAANLRPDYQLLLTPMAEACDRFCDQVNARVHRETRRARPTGWRSSATRLHPLPHAPYTVALGNRGWWTTTRRSGSERAVLHPARPVGA